MKKAAGKRTTTSKKKVGSLRARSGKTGNVKGGFLGSVVNSIGKNIGGPVHVLGPTAPPPPPPRVL